MRPMLIAGNWKMHGSASSVEALVTTVTSEVGDNFAANVSMAVFPPAIYVQDVIRLVGEAPIGVGGQHIDWHDQGAYTGEVSGPMLKDAGCEYCLVGHSERRQLFGDTDESVAMRYEAALAAGLKPVLCIGETLEERRDGSTIDVVTRQIGAVVDHIGIEWMTGVIAYEPVWAIGTGESATPAQAQEVHAAIRAYLGGLDENTAAETQLLYGGSVNAGNASALFAEEDIDGALIGGASLKGAEFAEIYRQACHRE